MKWNRRFILPVSRYLILVAPLAAAPACLFNSNSPCPDQTTVVSLAQAQASQGDGGGVPDAMSIAGMTTVTPANCGAVCDAVYQRHEDGCMPTTDDAGMPAAACTAMTPCHTGRVPAGLQASGAVHAESEVAAYLARAAHLEGASVHAFVHMARELEAHGAPRSLVRAARRAAGEEVRHARAMTRWAHSAGARPEAPVVATAPVRSLEDMLAENAREGCVRETFGAVLAAYQARAAHDAEARATLDAIARDEKSHAELSWRVAQWGESKLDARARRRMATIRREAADELHGEATREPSSALQRELGLPSSQVARALLDALKVDLWDGATVVV